MERVIYVSNDGGICAYSMTGELRGHSALEGCGVLCVSKENLLCAANAGSVVFKLAKDTLIPQALFPGGPGLCDMAVSRDGKRLYMLCGDADSIVMCDAQTGSALLLNRAGSNPRHMAFDRDTLAIAGGESGCVHLFSAKTLQAQGCVSMPGPVYSVALDSGVIYALCMTQNLSSQLVAALPDGSSYALYLSGMPGRLLIDDGMLITATQGYLYLISRDGSRILHRTRAPGRAGQLLCAQGRLYLCDVNSERLFASGEAYGSWSLFTEAARSLAMG